MPSVRSGVTNELVMPFHCWWDLIGCRDWKKKFNKQGLNHDRYLSSPRGRQRNCPLSYFTKTVWLSESQGRPLNRFNTKRPFGQLTQNDNQDTTYHRKFHWIFHLPWHRPHPRLRIPLYYFPSLDFESMINSRMGTQAVLEKVHDVRPDTLG